jgi:hypothetical protein
MPQLFSRKNLTENLKYYECHFSTTEIDSNTYTAITGLPEPYGKAEVCRSAIFVDKK